MNGPKGKTADADVFGSDLTGRASSPALSDTSELTVLSRSPSPVPYYQTFPGIMTALPLTPPNTPDRSRAVNGRFAPCGTKRASTPDNSSSSKKSRSSKEPLVPDNPPSPWSPRTSRSPRKFFKDAVPSVAKPVVSVSSPWVAGQGGCGTLEVFPKEIRQKFYGFAFGLDKPVTMKLCCGPQTTARERGACKKHGNGAAREAGRFNILQVSKMMRSEATWVVTTQATLVLEVDKALERYLRCYRWNSQRRSTPVSAEDSRKVMMWEAVSYFRDIRLELPHQVLYSGDPGVYMNDIVEAAFSLCQSWAQEQSGDVTPQRTVSVDLGFLFGSVIPSNFSYQNNTNIALNQLGRHFAGLVQPDLAKIATDTGNNLHRLLSIVNKYRGQSKWSFIADAQLDDHEAYSEGAEWLHAFQVACTGFDLPFEDSSPKPVVYHMPWKTT